MNRGVEIGVVADSRRQGEFRLALRDERGGEFRGARRARAQTLREAAAQRDPRLAAERHQAVQRRLHAGRERLGAEPFERSQHIERAEVEHAVTDGDAAAEVLPAPQSAEDGERQVLDGEVAAGQVGGLHPAAQLRIMSRVEGGGHPWGSLKRFVIPRQHCA